MFNFVSHTGNSDLKSQWATIIHPLEWWKLKRLIEASIGEDVEQLKFSFAFGGVNDSCGLEHMLVVSYKGKYVLNVGHRNFISIYLPPKMKIYVYKKSGWKFLPQFYLYYPY